MQDIAKQLHHLRGKCFNCVQDAKAKVQELAVDTIHNHEIYFLTI